MIRSEIRKGKYISYSTHAPTGLLNVLHENSNTIVN